MDLFLYDNGLRHERVNLVFRFMMLSNECNYKITFFHRLLKKPRKTQCLQCNSFFEARTEKACKTKNGGIVKIAKIVHAEVLSSPPFFAWCHENW